MGFFMYICFMKNKIQQLHKLLNTEFKGTNTLHANEVKNRAINSLMSSFRNKPNKN